MRDKNTKSQSEYVSISVTFCLQTCVKALQQILSSKDKDIYQKQFENCIEPVIRRIEKRKKTLTKARN